MTSRKPEDRNIDAFHAHLDECEQCREEPFNLCPMGAELIVEITKEMDALGNILLKSEQ